ncbi:tail fiber protein from prophage CP-933H [Escherichia coli]|uniref:Tail fiber protein from prophage CP-933H n=2 Tax=Escherichia coli TaxID=562 RepID=A0A376JWP4_ECOLX|nr:tail fiber protein from prophage CP-933H [Escherichia coli]
MPNTVMTEWADMVFLKFNGATFSAATYPILALVLPGLTLPDARGEFPRIWDDGRGVDNGRALLSSQIATSIGRYVGTDGNTAFIGINNTDTTGSGYASWSRVSATSTGVFGQTEYQGVRPRNIAFNFLVRAK